MTDLKVPPENAASEPVMQDARLLTVGDRIGPGFLPRRQPAEVAFVHHYSIGDEAWVFVTYVYPDNWPDADYFRGHAKIPLTVMADAFGYSREADDPTPVSPARVPLHTGSVVKGNELIVDGPELGPDPNHACAAHDDAHLGQRCPDRTTP
jgi:hypothetical protein